LLLIFQKTPNEKCSLLRNMCCKCVAPEEESITIIRNGGKYFSFYTAYHFRRRK